MEIRPSKDPLIRWKQKVRVGHKKIPVQYCKTAEEIKGETMLTSVRIPQPDEENKQMLVISQLQWNFMVFIG